ncbi:MAG: ABC transporter permease [Treponema sp.]|nr:ABC transporter permease [Treponema sp.]
MSNVSTFSEKEKPKKTYSQFEDVWRRFRKNKTAMVGLFIVIILILCAIFADVIAPGDGINPGYDVQDPENVFLRPSLRHPFGTDNFGRDIFARIIHGSRISLAVGFIVVGIALVVGTTLGSLAGFYGKVVDNVIMRLVDTLLAIPGILLAISIAAALGPGLYNTMISVGIGAIPSYARIVRASVLTLKELEFVEAARSVGASDLRIISRHILPNCMAPIIVQATIGLAGAILAAAGLSFLGIGIQLPIPEWGAMLSAGRRFIRLHPHLTIFPGLAIVTVVLGLNMMGDGLRDAFDPKLKK